MRPTLPPTPRPHNPPPPALPHIRHPLDDCLAEFLFSILSSRFKIGAE